MVFSISNTEWLRSIYSFIKVYAEDKEETDNDREKRAFCNGDHKWNSKAAKPLEAGGGNQHCIEHHPVASWRVIHLWAGKRYANTRTRRYKGYAD